jgi:integrase
MKQSKVLSALAIERLTKRGLYRDMQGLYLRVGETGTKSWIFRYMLVGKPHSMGLGSYPEVSLARARDLAGEMRAAMRGINPIDPLAARRANLAKMKAETDHSFGAAAESWLTQQKEKWTNERYAGQVDALVRKSCSAIWSRPVASIGKTEVIAVLEPVWSRTAVTASRLRMYIQQILDRAVFLGWREPGDNPARWVGHLQHGFIPQSSHDVEHMAALPFTDAPALALELRAHDDVAARALEFTLLTAARTGEVLGAVWSEIDLTTRTWIVPAERMKAKVEHRVPLSDRAVQLIEQLPPGTGERVFFGLSPIAMRRLLLKLRPGYMVHGLRSSFKDFAGERAHAPAHIIEMCLAHAVGDAVMQAYGRSDLITRRATLMQQWASFLERPIESADVVPIAGRAAVS